MKTTSQRGFSFVEGTLIVAVVALIGVVGYRAYDQMSASSDSTTSTSQSPTANDVPAAPVIESEQSLTEAEKTLDQTKIENSNDSTALDSEMSGF